MRAAGFVAESIWRYTLATGWRSAQFEMAVQVAPGHLISTPSAAENKTENKAGWFICKNPMKLDDNYRSTPTLKETAFFWTKNDENDQLRRFFPKMPCWKLVEQNVAQAPRQYGKPRKTRQIMTTNPTS